MLAGGLGGTAFWLACYPLDVVKSKIQIDSFTRPQYKGMVDCAKKVRGNMTRSLLAISTCTCQVSWRKLLTIKWIVMVCFPLCLRACPFVVPPVVYYSLSCRVWGASDVASHELYNVLDYQVTVLWDRQAGEIRFAANW